MTTISPPPPGDFPAGDYPQSELLHDGESHTIHRVRGEDQSSHIVKSPAARNLSGGGRLEIERHILERLRGVEGCPQLVNFQRPGRSLSTHDGGGMQLDASGLMGHLDLEGFLALSEKLARLVAAIHERGVIHRAIEPAHILVRLGDMGIELIDYGAASTFIEEPSGDWKPNLALGNPLWIAPEQTGRMNRIVDWRTDLYSLGAVLYGLATGEPPFEADSVTEILHAHMAKLPKPPGASAPWMPQPVEKMILKLLAKEPDQRYQGAASLARDLALLRRALAEGAPLETITLPSSDIPARPRPPTRIHGRSKELQCLAEAFESVTCGGARRVFVAGHSGTGKSSLFHELHRPTALAGGVFVEGKCEQLGQCKPFHAPAKALDRLATLLLGESGCDVERLKERMGAIHRAGFAPLCAVAPALERLVGPFTPIEKSLSPEASTQIVGLTVDFLCAVCSPEYPVVLALDDLQWADAPTLGLLKRLLGETRLEGFLLVGAYRDEEVGPSHPLAALLQGADSPARARELITLKDLGSGAIASMLEDMLGTSQPDLPDLAQALLSKTGGNPYFTVELVDLLWREGSLKADAATAKWKWNAAAIQALGVTANVADLLARDLGSLPHSTQDTLCAMACLGSECGLGMLGLATATETHDAALLLEPALTAGVLVTSDAIAFQSRDSEARLRFCHDRMQQAALRILPPADLALLRLEIARRLSIAEGLPDLVPRAAWCYAHAIDLLTSPKDRAIAREVFIRSAEISLISGDYTNAETHLRNAWSLLPADDRETGTADSGRILTHLHLACYCLGNHEEGDRIFQQLEETAATPEELAIPASIQVMSLSNRTRYQDAILLGGGLAEKLLGFPIPLYDSEPALRAEMEAFQKLFNTGHLGSIGSRAAPGGPGWNLAARLLNRMIPAAFFTSPQLASWLALRCGREWMENGYRPAFIYPMSCVGLASIALHNDYSTGWQVASKALQIGQSQEGGVETARAEHVFGLFSCHWFEPLEHSLAHARTAFETLSCTNELEFACYTFFTSQAAVFELGGHLDALRKEVSSAIDFAERTGNLHASQSFLAFRQTLRALEGTTAKPGGFDDDSFHEESHLREIAANPMARAFFHTYRALTACLFHDLEALDFHAEAAAALSPYITGFYPSALVSFLHSLALVERIRTGRDTGQAERRLEENQRWLAARATDQTVNFSQLHDLVEAERLDATGEFPAALALFEEARNKALEHKRPWHLALATERAARCFERHGLLMASRPLFTEALALHRQLGAHGKVADLVAKWPFLKSGIDLTSTKYSSPGGGLQSLAQAFQSLAEQQTVKALTERIAEWLADFTGATDVRILALDAEDRWILKASLGEECPIEPMSLKKAVQKDLVSETVLSLCEASNGFLLSHDATGDERFLRDPHFASMSACSLLAISVVIHSKPRALVVLENRLVRSAFQPAVVAMAQMLCGQLALAIGNIRNREALERLVDERTEGLQVAREREKTLDRTAYELTENIPVGTFALEFDRAGDPSFTFMSERWLDMLDLRRERAQANPSLALLGVHPGDREEFQRLQAEAFIAKVRFFWQGRLLVRGQTRWVTIESIPRRIASGRTVQEGVMIDITERMEAEHRERELEASHRLELRQKLKTALTAASIAHEISQPLARIIHTADLVEMHAYGALASHPRLGKFISELSADARLTSRIIDQMKKLLQNVKTEHERIDLAECVRNAILANSTSFRAHGIEIVLAEPKGLFSIHGDPAQIAIALGNLLQNGAQAMASHPGPLAPEILIQILRHPSEFEIRIGDTGLGIAEADIPKLLLRSTKAEGTGLGLFIVQAAMENHNGRLEIARSPLGGAEFRMRFTVGQSRKASKKT